MLPDLQSSSYYSKRWFIKCIDAFKSMYAPSHKKRLLLIKVDTVHSNVLKLLKFIYSEKATEVCKIFTLLLTAVHTVKTKVKIL